MRELLLLLAIVPIITYNLTDIYLPKRKWLWTGLALGMVVAPVSMCLLQSTHIPVIGKILGLGGLILNIVHGPLGYFTVVAIGIHEPGTVLSAAQLTQINIINGFVWGMFYGVLGYNIDLKWPSTAEGKRLFAGAGKKAMAPYRK
ncbi:MAG: hypothetical protein KKG47_11835 [Proteobacteria bacterium]|nr:hypothetical protein [Pseudomonadota bacterium]MBU1737811.1 hypothetical protein [Pseudomonadota bacterium]